MTPLKLSSRILPSGDKMFKDILEKHSQRKSGISKKLGCEMKKCLIWKSLSHVQAEFEENPKNSLVYRVSTCTFWKLQAFFQIRHAMIDTIWVEANPKKLTSISYLKMRKMLLMGYTFFYIQLKKYYNLKICGGGVIRFVIRYLYYPQYVKKNDLN